MAVKLRLKRMGSKQKPFYRIIVADSRSPRDGRFIATVGTYNPLLADNKYSVKEEEIMTSPAQLSAAKVNGSDTISVVDVVIILNYIKELVIDIGVK